MLFVSWLDDGFDWSIWPSHDFRRDSLTLGSLWWICEFLWILDGWLATFWHSMDFSHFVTLMVVRQFNTLMTVQHFLLTVLICDSTISSLGLLPTWFLWIPDFYFGYKIFIYRFWMLFNTFSCQQDFLAVFYVSICESFIVFGLYRDDLQI